MEIKTVETYTDEFTLLDEHMDTDSFSDEFREWLEHVSDFEPIEFLVLNGQSVTVYDSICGDVVGSFETIDDFYRACLEEFQRKD